MWHFKLNIILILLPLATQNCSAGNGLKADIYTIDIQNDSPLAFNNWIVTEMTSRAPSDIIKVDGAPESMKATILSVSIAPEIDFDYCITREKNMVELKAKTESVAKWLVFQFIAAVSEEDERFHTEDLPPSTVNFNSHCQKFDFEYREPFLPSNLTAGNSEKLGTHSVDVNWGLWGHNLSKIIPTTPEMSATINGEKSAEQICFSSAALFDQFSDYIIDNYGSGDEMSYRFMIMPKDNDLVCSCELCTGKGATTNNASPAVASFIIKLAERFPKHWFFTSAYRTTKNPPDFSLPDHSGVFISTIDIPQGTTLSPESSNTVKFKEHVTVWEKVTNHVYVWDYFSNFDDYLTPLPNLYSLKQRLSVFKELKIKGVFLNGSGYDYSAFEDLKTFVAANLLRNIDSDIDNLIRIYSKKFYGKSASEISKYYLGLEKDFAQSKHSIDIYGGTQEALNNYLNVENFIKFHAFLDNTDYASNSRLEKLKIASNFTRLQIAYFSSITPDFKTKGKNKLIPQKKLKTTLSEFEIYKKYPELAVYREEQGSVEQYVSFWKDEIFQKKLLNQILHKNISVSESFEFQNHFLTDGLPGNKNDYHQGWFIAASDATWEWKSDFTAEKNMTLRFLKDEKHGFDKTERIVLKINNQDVPISIKEQILNKTIELSFPFKVEKGDLLTLILNVKNGRKSKIAVDEIRIL